MARVELEVMSTGSPRPYRCVVDGGLTTFAEQSMPVRPCRFSLNGGAFWASLGSKRNFTTTAGLINAGGAYPTRPATNSLQPSVASTHVGTPSGPYNHSSHRDHVSTHHRPSNNLASGYVHPQQQQQQQQQPHHASFTNRYPGSVAADHHSHPPPSARNNHYQPPQQHHLQQQQHQGYHHYPPQQPPHLEHYQGQPGSLEWGNSIPQAHPSPPPPQQAVPLPVAPPAQPYRRSDRDEHAPFNPKPQYHHHHHHQPHQPQPPPVVPQQHYSQHLPGQQQQQHHSLPPRAAVVVAPTGPGAGLTNNNGNNNNNSAGGIVHSSNGPSSRASSSSPFGTGSSPQRHQQTPPIATQDENAVFRKVRGILNKLTPEKFEKLTADILNVGLESTVILKGVILLIFEKALDEPKYSSMYAQLCKRLAEKAPNFDPPGKLCTFKRLLLTKCKDEFENRAQIAHENERRFESAAAVVANGPNANSNIAPPDIEEAKYMAKRKMLGNIKFIGELGKLQIVQESVLHKCCEQLLVGRRKQPLSDQVEDLECLCHLMKTCGKLLDTPKAKVRMDQYFERLQQVTDNEQMPTRIRFLVRDLLEMRMNRWMTRRVGKTPEGPRTIQQVREDAYRDGCIYMPQANSPPTKPTNHPLGGGMGVFMNPLEGSFFDTKPKGGDLFGKVSSNIIGFIPTSSGFLGTGPGTIHADGYDEPPIDLSPTPPNRPSNGFGGMDKDLGNRGPSETRAFTPNNPSNNNSSSSSHKNNNNPKHFRQNSGSSSGDNSSSVHSSTADFSNFRKGGAGSGAGDNGNNRPQQLQQQPHHQNDRFGNSRGDKHLDFGDRYSANRTKDRQRRERETHQSRNGHFERDNFDNQGGRDHGGGDSSSFFNNRSADGHHPRDNQRGGYDRDEHRSSFNSQDTFDNNRWNNRLNQQDNRRHGDNNRSNFRENRDNRDRPQGGGGFRRDRFERNEFPPPGSRNHNQFNEDFPPAGSAMSNSGPGLLPPRLKKMVLNQGGPGGKDLEISLRPQVANNMLFKPKTPSMLPKSAQRGHSDGSPLGENSLLGPAALSHQSKIMMTTNEPLIIKQGSLEKGGRKEKNRAGNKGPTRDEVFAKMEVILANLLEHQSTNEAAESWKENNWLPTKMNQTAVTHFLKLTLDKDESQRELACNLMHQLVKDGTINATHCFEGISKLMSQVSEMEKSQPAVKNHLADLAQWLVKEKLVSLKELADILEDRSGGLYPILLLTLQRLLKSIGQEEVKALVDKVSPPLLLVQHVPADHQSDEKLVQVLEDFQLSFLVPLLIIQQDMSKQLQMVSDPNTLFKWIQGNVDKETQEQPGFIRALFQIVVTHIVQATTLSPDSDPTVQPDKAAMEQEKERLTQFRSVLQPFVQDSPQLQLHAVYALHLFCHQKSFPKGMLLRFFINFYELDIMDEHAFLQWKEDVNEAFPGKGEALFQVNQWLTWLEEAESEEEDDDDNE